MASTEIISGLFLGTREDAEAFGACVPGDWACISVTEYRSRYLRKEELPREPDGSLDLPFMVDRSARRVVGWHADCHKLDLIAEVIDAQLRSGRRVLVHCVHAKERSPLAVVWYLAWKCIDPSIELAYQRVLRLHPKTERRDPWLAGAVPNMRSSR